MDADSGWFACGGIAPVSLSFFVKAPAAVCLWHGRDQVQVGGFVVAEIRSRSASSWARSGRPAALLLLSPSGVGRAGGLASPSLFVGAVNVGPGVFVSRRALSWFSFLYASFWCYMEMYTSLHHVFWGFAASLSARVLLRLPWPVYRLSSCGASLPRFPCLLVCGHPGSFLLT